MQGDEIGRGASDTSELAREAPQSMASARSAGAWVSNWDVNADPDFLDELAAANRWKSFLLGTGHEVDDEVSVGLAGLLAVFAPEVTAYEFEVGLIPQGHIGVTAAMMSAPSVNSDPGAMTPDPAISPTRHG